MMIPGTPSYKQPLLTTLRLVSAAAILALTACSVGGDDGKIKTSTIDDGKAGFNINANILSYGSASLRAATAQGLVQFDDQGRLVPALAERWVVTDDGLSYIFRLREIKWQDGRALTAERVAKLLSDRFKQLSNSSYGVDLKPIDKVLAMTGRVIEIQLSNTSPNLLQILAQPEFGLLRSGHGSGPMESSEAFGALQLSPYVAEGTVEPEEESTDDRLVILRTDSAAMAVARFATGRSNVVLGGKFHHLPYIPPADLNAQDIRLDPVSGLFGLKFVEQSGPWQDVKYRQAIAMAIDRPALLTQFNISGWQSMVKIVPDPLDATGSVGRPTWAELTIGQRQTIARQAMADWTAANGNIAPLRIALPDGPGGGIFFARLKLDLQKIGVPARRVKLSDDADIRLVDEVAAYDSPLWFLNRLTCAQSSVCSEDADALIQQATEARNLDDRAAKMAEAEVMLTRFYSYVPLGVPVRWSLASSDLLGFAVNPRGWHPLNYLGVDPT